MILDVPKPNGRTVTGSATRCATKRTYLVNAMCSFGLSVRAHLFGDLGELDGGVAARVPDANDDDALILEAARVLEVDRV